MLNLYLLSGETLCGELCNLFLHAKPLIKLLEIQVHLGGFGVDGVLASVHFSQE